MPLHRLRREAGSRGVNDEVEAAELLDSSGNEPGRAVAGAQVAVRAARSDHSPAIGSEALRDRMSDLPRPACDQRAAVWSL